MASLVVNWAPPRHGNDVIVASLAVNWAPPRHRNDVIMASLAISWAPPRHSNGIIVNYELVRTTVFPSCTCVSSTPFLQWIANTNMDGIIDFFSGQTCILIPSYRWATISARYTCIVSPVLLSSFYIFHYVFYERINGWNTDRTLRVRRWECKREYTSDGVCGVLENMNLVVIYLDHLSLKNKGTVGVFRRILELTGGRVAKADEHESLWVNRLFWERIVTVNHKFMTRHSGDRMTAAELTTAADFALQWRSRLSSGAVVITACQSSHGLSMPPPVYNSRTRRPSVPKFGMKVPHFWRNSHTSFKVKRSKVKVSRPINAHTHRAPYLPNGKAYELQTLYNDGGRRPASATGAITSKIRGQSRKVMWSIWAILAKCYTCVIIGRRGHTVSATLLVWCRTAADPQTKPINLSCQSTCRLMSSIPIVAICFYFVGN